jgi:hypothetical protein
MFGPKIGLEWAKQKHLGLAIKKYVFLKFLPGHASIDPS